jgi:transposase
VCIVGLDEPSLKRGQQDIIVVHSHQAKQPLSATEGRDKRTVAGVAADLTAHAPKARHLCMDMSTAYAKGVGIALSQAQVSYGRFHVVSMAIEAMGQVRRHEMTEGAPHVRSARGHSAAQLMRGSWRSTGGWNGSRLEARRWLQCCTFMRARTWPLAVALRTVYAQAHLHDDPEQAAVTLRAWLSRAAQFEPLLKLAATPRASYDAVAHRTLEHRSNAFVAAMDRLPQQVEPPARGFTTRHGFIAIAYLRMYKLKHLPATPFLLAGTVGKRRVPQKTAWGLFHLYQICPWVTQTFPRM